LFFRGNRGRSPHPTFFFQVGKGAKLSADTGTGKCKNMKLSGKSGESEWLRDRGDDGIRINFPGKKRKGISWGRVKRTEGNRRPTSTLTGGTPSQAVLLLRGFGMAKHQRKGKLGVIITL